MRSRDAGHFFSFSVLRAARSTTAIVWVCLLTLLTLASFAAQSETHRVDTPEVFWPPAPDARRIQYVRSISVPMDIGSRPSLLSRVGHWFTGIETESLALQKPFGVAVDELGNLCITDMGAKRICYCDFTHKTWRHYERIGNTSFGSPVAVVSRNRIFYVADSALGKVIAFNQGGGPVWESGKLCQRPVGLGLVDNQLAVVDVLKHCVLILNLQGQLQFAFGQRGPGPGEFNYPTHIAADRQGRWLVVDSLNSRVQVFDQTGKFVSQFGSNGDTSGHFSRPKGVAVDQFGHVYVADAMFDNIQVFSLSGQFLLNLGKTGAGPGEFSLPSGLATGPNNEIYVADAFNRRVQVLQYVGEPNS